MIFLKELGFKEEQLGDDGQETETNWKRLLEEGPLSENEIMELSQRFYELIDPLVGVC